MPRFPCCLLLVLLAIPSLSGAAAREPVTIHLADPHVGDRMAYEWPATVDPDGKRVDRVPIIVRIEPTGVATDSAGVKRSVDVYRVDQYFGDRLDSQTRCHALSGGREAVRLDVLYQRPHPSPRPPEDPQDPVSRLLGGTNAKAKPTDQALFDFGPCMGQSIVAGRTLREGDRLELEEIALSTTNGTEHDLSKPAVATQFHGRPALSFAFDKIRYVLADGLPGPVITAWSETASYTLTAFSAGSGPALAPYVGVTLPRANSHASFVGYDPSRFESSYGFAYPLDAALADLRADPLLPVAGYFDAHPHARLTDATYTDDEQLGQPKPERVRSWRVQFSDDQETLIASTQRLAVSQGDHTVGAPASTIRDHYADVRPTKDRLGTAPDRVATADSILRVVDAVSPGFGAITSLQYHASSYEGRAFVLLFVSDAPCCEDGAKGSIVALDGIAAKALSIQGTQTSVETTGVLAPSAQELDRRDDAHLAAASFLSAPAAGSGLAGSAAAATSVALFAILVKFLLVPFYTRLRRATLLDHPARARLYEQIRAEPGIHQAELVDLAGLGRGATERHLRQLARHGFVVELRADGRVRYYAAGEVPRDVAAKHAALRSGSAREVHALFSREPDLSLREAGARLRLSAPSVHRAKKRLERAGLLPAPPGAATVDLR